MPLSNPKVKQEGAMQENGKLKRLVKTFLAIIGIIIGVLDLFSVVAGEADHPKGTALLGIALIMPGAWWFYCNAQNKDQRHWYAVWIIFVALFAISGFIDYPLN